MNGMLEHYLYDFRPDGQNRTIDLFLRDGADALTTDERARMRELGRCRRALFEVRKIRPGLLELEEVLGGARHEVVERRSLVALSKGDILEARLLPHEGKLHFSRSFVFHPREVRRAILKEAQRLTRAAPAGAGARRGRIPGAALPDGAKARALPERAGRVDLRLRGAAGTSRQLSADRKAAMDFSLLEFVPDAIVVADDQGAIVYANAMTEQLFGWSRDELVGQAVEVLLPARHRQRPHRPAPRLPRGAPSTPHGARHRPRRPAQGRQRVPGGDQPLPAAVRGDHLGGGGGAGRDRAAAHRGQGAPLPAGQGGGPGPRRVPLGGLPRAADAGDRAARPAADAAAGGGPDRRARPGEGAGRVARPPGAAAGQPGRGAARPLPHPARPHGALPRTGRRRRRWPGRWRRPTRPTSTSRAAPRSASWRPSRWWPPSTGSASSRCSGTCSATR